MFSIHCVLVWVAMSLAVDSASAESIRFMEYGVVIDAGSSGSRVRVYSWTPRANVDEVPDDLSEIFNFKVYPGLSSFEDNLDGIEPYIMQLVAKAEENVPRESQSLTPIFLLATAGMRLVPEETSTLMMNTVEEILSIEDACPFKFSPTNARILSGEEEGVFAWIDVNYHLGTFFEESSQSVGLLEMGGASAQITFLPEGDPLANMFPVKLNGVDYKLYAHSYLAYGLDYEEIWLAQYLWEAQGRPSSINYPCMFEGDTITLTMDAAGSPEVLLVGQSNPKTCLSLTKQFVYEVNPLYCHPEPCAIGPVYQPPIPENMHFYAVSAFVYTTNDLQAIYGDVIDDEGFVTPESILLAAKKICRLNLNEALEKSTQDPQYARNLCRAAIYFGELLGQGYDFDSQDKQIKITNDANGQDLAWTLGALLYELGQ